MTLFILSIQGWWKKTFLFLFLFLFVCLLFFNLMPDQWTVNLILIIENNRSKTNI